MLAKIWKKLLLAICIVACIYNVMNKIVNRHSLEDNLNSANDGETVFLLPNEKDNKKITSTNATSSNSAVITEESNTIENNVVQSEDTNENNTQENNSTDGVKYKSLFNFDFLFKNT